MDVRTTVISFVTAVTLITSDPAMAEDVAAARQRFAQLLSEQTSQDPEPASVSIAWTSQEGTVPTFYLVTSPNCGACPAAMRNATAAGIDYEVISVREARSLGLFSATERALVPQLICSDDAKNRIVGAHASSKMKSWAVAFPTTDGPAMMVTVPRDPSIELLIDCLAAHLAGKDDELPTSSSSLLRKTIITPAFVTEMISQLMTGGTIHVADTGASIEWSGQDRTIQFESTDRITINPPMTVAIKKLGIRLTTTLNYIKINEAGREIRLGLHGPDITFRLQNDKK